MITKTGRCVHEQPGGMGHDVQIGDREGDGLIPADGPAEGLPLQCVAPREIAARSNAAKRERRHGDPPVVQRRQELRVALTALAQKMIMRHAQVGEAERMSVGGVPAELVVTRRRSGRSSSAEP